MSYKNKKGCATLNYIKHFLTLDFAVTGCIDIYAFAARYFYGNCEFYNRIKYLCDNWKN